jgi:hypothetical protein
MYFFYMNYKTQMYRRYKYTCTHMHARVEYEGDKKKNEDVISSIRPHVFVA